MEQAAYDTRAKHLDQISRAHVFQRTVTTSPHWQHFNNDKDLGPWKSALNDLESSAKRPKRERD